MVVVPEGTDALRAEQALHMARLKARVTDVPVDFVVVTEGDLREHGHSPGLVYREVERDGRELYVA